MTSTALESAGGTRHPRTVVGVVLAFFGAIALTIGLTGSPAGAQAATGFIPLANSVADVGTDCPDSVGDYWNFAIVPNDGTYAFVTISLNLGGSTVDFSGGSLISNGSADNVFVAVPDGYAIGDLNSFGSEAEITPPSADASSGYVEFRLDYVCGGVGSTTTTTVAETTTTVAETTTTVAETTTTVAETTTTVEDTTTTVEETTTTAVGSGGPTTSAASAAPTTAGTANNAPTTTVLGELPRTGPDATNTMLVLGALLLLIGGVMVLSTRREHELV